MSLPKSGLEVGKRLRTPVLVPSSPRVAGRVEKRARGRRKKRKR